MNKNMLISIIIVAIAIITTSYFFNRHEHENSLNEFGHEIGHELDEIGDNIKKKSE